MEGLLIAVFTPVVGWLIDLYGSVDRVLAILGQCFLLGLTLLALTSVVRSLKHPQRSQFARSALERDPHERFGQATALSGQDWRGECKEKGVTLHDTSTDNNNDT